MQKPSRGDAATVAAAVGAEAPIPLKLDHASMSDIAHALVNGHVTASALVKAYLARIEAYDRDGPKLNAVRALNPDTLAIAGRLDGVKPSASRPLAGIPILVKDNIATGGELPTTAGSLALEGAQARADATIVRLLREAGAVILGKANLTEFSNMLAVDMPAGYSSLGGQVKNPTRWRWSVITASRSCRRADRAPARRSQWRLACVRPRSARKLRGRCCGPPARTALSRSNRRSG